MNNLFLSGDRQIGKSSLLRKCLAPCRDKLGGFSSQRLLDASGAASGYRLAEPGDFAIERAYEPSLSNIFITAAQGGRICDIAVFDRAAGLLIPPAGAKIMLLDEIGGIDLLSVPFKESLYALLASDVPCIGTIKSCGEKRAPGQSGNASEPPAQAQAADPTGRASYKDENARLRRFLADDKNSTVINLDGAERLYEEDASRAAQALEEAIRAFLSCFSGAAPRT